MNPPDYNLDPVAASEIKRLDELAKAESRRIDGLLSAQQKAVDAALAAAEKAVAAALAASEKAVNKAEVAQQRVNETQNEFRGTLRDQALTLMPKTEQENTNRELRELIGTQLTQIGELRSRLDIGPPTLHTLQTRSDESAGRIAGVKETFADIKAVILVIVAIGGFVLGIFGSNLIK